MYTLGFPAVPLVAGSPLFTLTNGATATVTLEAIPDMYSPFVACRFMLSNGQHLSGGGGSELEKRATRGEVVGDRQVNSTG